MSNLTLTNVFSSRAPISLSSTVANQLKMNIHHYIKDKSNQHCDFKCNTAISKAHIKNDALAPGFGFTIHQSNMVAGKYLVTNFKQSGYGNGGGPRHHYMACNGTCKDTTTNLNTCTMDFEVENNAITKFEHNNLGYDSIKIPETGDAKSNCTGWSLNEEGMFVRAPGIWIKAASGETLDLSYCCTKYDESGCTEPWTLYGPTSLVLANVCIDSMGEAKISQGETTAKCLNKFNPILCQSGDTENCAIFPGYTTVLSFCPESKCSSISPEIPDEWCEANCNADKPYCPPNKCHCS